MKSKLLRTLLLAVNFVFLQTAFANNVQVSNILLTGQNTDSQFTLVQFDITWENSWRDVGNGDAAWVFMKFSTDGGATWNHATFATLGHTAPSGSTIDTPSDGKGVFIYRSSNGSGTVNFSGVQLRWKYGADGVADNAVVRVKVFAIEMVFVPQAEFAAGNAGTGASQVIKTTINTADATVAPSGNGSLGGQAGGYPTGQTAPSNASWPNGFSAFYCMKYEITQEQYRDFLNCLTYDQQNTRTATSPDDVAGTAALSNPNRNRNGIDIQTPGVASTTPALYANNLDDDTNFNEPVDGQTIACNLLSWMDGCAYADWAGLRPFTELEYEKACRGSQLPLADEFAWGTTSIAGSPYTLANAGAANEEIATNYATTLGVGNASYSPTDGAIDGPLRVGIFAGNANNTTDSRVRSGAGFYGVMEMSGNLYERPVTIGNATGRNFTGTLGDGTLSANGNATNTDWPGFAAGEVTGAIGSGFRGGTWLAFSTPALVSDRSSAAMTVTTRRSDQGFRCVRQAP